MTDFHAHTHTTEAPDGHRIYTLTEAQHRELVAVAPVWNEPGSKAERDATDARNAWWLATGAAMGFLWNTVQLVDPQPEAFTFTAVPEPSAADDTRDDTDAKAWLAQAGCLPAMITGPVVTHWPSTVYKAFAAGRDTGYAMGATEAEVHQARVRVLEGQMANALELLAAAQQVISGAAALYGYASQAEMAERMEAFANEPANSTLVHDGLREAREDAANGVVAGWTAALSAVRGVIDDMQLNTGPSALPPLVLISRMNELEAPDDLDELLNPWRGVMLELHQIAALRGPRPSWAMEITGGGWSMADHARWARSAVQAWSEWQRAFDWVQGADLEPVLGRGQWGRLIPQIVRDLLEWSNTAHDDALTAVEGLQEALGMALDLAAEIRPKSNWTTDELNREASLRLLAMPAATNTARVQVRALLEAMNRKRTTTGREAN